MWQIDSEMLVDIFAFFDLGSGQNILRIVSMIRSASVPTTLSTTLISDNVSICGSQTPQIHKSVIKTSTQVELLHTVISFMIDDQTKQARSPNASQTSSCTYMHVKADRMTIESMIKANTVIHNHHNHN